jgi:CheY-like chemotaxis protein
VEDSSVLAKVSTIMLEKMGTRFVAIADGLQAVNTIAKSRGN